MAAEALPQGSRRPAPTRGDALEQYKMARDEELRRLENQRRQLDSMRQRAAQYLGFVGAATAFLAGTGLAQAERTTSFYALAAAATATSVVTILLSISVFLGINPRRMRPMEWEFTLAPGAMMAMIEQQLRKPDEVDLTKWVMTQYAQMSTANDPKLSAVQAAYVSALALGASQLLLWTLLVWTGA